MCTKAKPKLRLLHYGSEPLLKVHSVKQCDTGRLWKPNGLWVSVKGPDDWLTWCKAENFGTERLRHTTEVILTPDAKILHLKTAEDIDAFSARYAYDPYQLHTDSQMAVHWDEVATLYQGIIIAPYCYERRFPPHTFWYYTWDCASGCIWDAEAVAKLKLVTKGACHGDGDSRSGQ